MTVVRRQDDGGGGGGGPRGNAPTGRPRRGQRFGWFVAPYLLSITAFAAVVYALRFLAMF